MVPQNPRASMADNGFVLLMSKNRLDQYAFVVENVIKCINNMNYSKVKLVFPVLPSEIEQISINKM